MSLKQALGFNVLLHQGKSQGLSTTGQSLVMLEANCWAYLLLGPKGLKGSDVGGFLALAPHPISSCASG